VQPSGWQARELELWELLRQRCRQCVAALSQPGAQPSQVRAPRRGGDEVERGVLERPGDEEVVDDACCP